MRIGVTGGCGFIGSNFIRKVLERAEVVNLDKLTYAGNPANTADFAANPKYRFLQGDICDARVVDQFAAGVDVIVHFAAETHVDRSIMDPDAFLVTNVIGTYRLLQTAVKHKVKKFIHVSTDEVYGSIEEGAFTENDAHNPSSPYAASKDGGDRLAHAFYVTHQLPVVIVRPANTYGPFQYPEKVMPLFITNVLEGKKLPMYGDGLQRRDWLFVEDLCDAVLVLIEKGSAGEAYNVPGGNELMNLDMTKMILAVMGKDEASIEHVRDRPGHDRRYAMTGEKLAKLGWQPNHEFDAGLQKTVSWYKENATWWENIKSGEFKEYYKRQYG